MKKYPITIIILFTTLICFLSKSLISYDTFGLHSLLSNNFKVVQLLTYPLLHGNILHLGINLLMFYVFSKPIEKKIGSFRYIILYLSLSILTGIYFIYSNITYNSLVGLSGICFGLMCYFMILFPKSKLTIMFLFNIKTEFVVILLILVECVLLFFNKHIAHDVHLIGCLIGLIASIFTIFIPKYKSVL